MVERRSPGARSSWLPRVSTGLVPLLLASLLACGAPEEQAAPGGSGGASTQSPAVPSDGSPSEDAPSIGTQGDTTSGQTDSPAQASGAATNAPPNTGEASAGSSVVGPAMPPASGEIPGGPPVVSTVPASSPSPVDFGEPGATDILPGSGPLGVETTCDGVDDDANGVVDDVDLGGDGVCDCLAIATLGLHGEWGGGDVVTDWLSQRIETTISDLGDATLTPELLQPYQLLLIRDVSANHTPGLSFSAAEADALWQWVRDGGGLMTVIGYSDAGEINNVNTLLAPFGVKYGPDQIIPGEGSAVPVTEWFEHPVSAGISRVGADNGYPTLGQGTVIASFDEYDVGIGVTIGDGHLLVWGDEWVTYADEWSGSTEFQVDVFWQNTLRWLTRANECQVPSP